MLSPELFRCTIFPYLKVASLVLPMLVVQFYAWYVPITGLKYALPDTSSSTPEHAASHAASQQSHTEQRCAEISISCPCGMCQNYFSAHYVALMIPAQLLIMMSDSPSAYSTAHINVLFSLSIPPPHPPPIYI